MCRATRKRLILRAVAALLLVACGGSGGQDNQNNGNGASECPTGTDPDGPACVPRFDSPTDCPGDQEMPVLGGGCVTVGVQECAGGLRVESACQPVGVRQRYFPLRGKTAASGHADTGCISAWWI